jgi:hypothetical protein
MTGNRDTLVQEVQSFLAQLDALYGHYLDCTLGFQAIHARFVEIQQRGIRDFPGTGLDSRNIFLGRGAPDDPSIIIQHRTTQGEFKTRNAPSGSNHIRAAQLLIVLIFAFWESRYRASIASALGTDPENLKVPILGDLRRLRNDIVHCQGIVQKDTASKLQVLTELKADAPIVLSDDNVLALVQHIKATFGQLTIDPAHALTLTSN